MMEFLFVSTADWDNPYWTNKQHVAKELGRRGHRLLYVESQGLRKPTATGRDVKRILNRLKKGLRPPRLVVPGVWVWSPIVIPFQGNNFVRRINKMILRAGLFLACAWAGIRPRFLWTYSPMTTELYHLDSYEKIIYHAVDDVKEQPGMPAATIAQAEARLTQRADIIFTTSPHLQAMHAAINPQTHFFPNVADFAHFQQAMNEKTSVPADLAALPSPRIGFVGAISGYKLDFALIGTLARQKPDWSIVMIGEIGEGDPMTDASFLKNYSNIHLMGGKPYALLPAYLKGMDVAILPSALNDYTRSMFPMKFFEYLAAGKPVVATDLPALSDYKSVAALCPTEASFIAAIEDALAGKAPALDARLAAAREQTYEGRTAKMLDLIEKLPQKPVD